MVTPIFSIRAISASSTVAVTGIAECRYATSHRVVLLLIDRDVITLVCQRHTGLQSGGPAPIMATLPSVLVPGR